VSVVILVTGATGRVGYHVLEALADVHADVTAMVRVQAKADDLPGTTQHVVATFDDPPPAEVLRGFDRVFLLSPAIEEQAELETVFIDALVAAGHGPHVVKIAADGFADPGCDVRFMVSHRQVAAHLDATGLPATYLAPALYMEDLLAFAGPMRSSAEIAVPAGHGRVGLVAASDVAAVAAQVLTGPGHEGAVYTLTGPESLRFKDVAGRISTVFAREVAYTDQPPGRARQQLLASGVSQWRADGNLELFDWIRQGGADNVTTAVREVTGADPQPVQDWLEESRADFEVPPPDLPRSVF
jgi:NAD(P)H dehydrogenase (quinone)